MPEFITHHGLLEYPNAITAMEQRVEDVITGTAPELLWLVEHPPLYTAGTSANTTDLLDAQRFPVYHTGRGGEFTYHGPGQRVAYVMLNLKARNQQDVRQYVYHLEQWIINTLAVLGVQGERRDGRVGIWVAQPDGREHKIAAIGIRIRKWVTYHGIALNVNPDLSHFAGIVPCGIREHGVTSLHALRIQKTMQEVDVVLLDEFQKMF